MNDRPLSYRKHGKAEGEFQPITPNMLLLTSRSLSAVPILDEFDEQPEKFAKRLKYRESCLESWWSAWITSSFDNLIIRSKWKTTQRNLRVGDVVMIKAQGRLIPGEYHRGIVKEVFESKDGLVRNVIVQRYRHDKRRQVDVYKGEGQVLTKFAVQSLILLLPVEEQAGDGASNHDPENPVSHSDLVDSVEEQNCQDLIEITEE